MAKQKKTPQSLFADASKKRVRMETDSSIQKSPVWSFCRVDIGGRWCWGKLTPEELICIVTRLRSLETMTWAEISQNTGSHPVKTGDMIKDAQSRLVEIKADDCDELFSMRFKGLIRIWGIRTGDTFQFLWCDPKHEVCPSILKHS